MADEFNPSEGVRLEFCCGIKRVNPNDILLTRVMQKVDAFLMHGNNVTLLARTSKDNPFFIHRSPDYHLEGRFLEFEGDTLERIYREIFEVETYGPRRGGVFVDFIKKKSTKKIDDTGVTPQQPILSLTDVENELIGAYCLAYTLAKFQEQGPVSANRLGRRNERLNVSSESLDKLPDWVSDFNESIRKIIPNEVGGIFDKALGWRLGEY